MSVFLIKFSKPGTKHKRLKIETQRGSLPDLENTKQHARRHRLHGPRRVKILDGRLEGTNCAGLMHDCRFFHAQMLIRQRTDGMSCRQRGQLIVAKRQPYEKAKKIVGVIRSRRDQPCNWAVVLWAFALCEQIGRQGITRSTTERKRPNYDIPFVASSGSNLATLLWGCCESPNTRF